MAHASGRNTRSRFDLNLNLLLALRATASTPPVAARAVALAADGRHHRNPASATIARCLAPDLPRSSPRLALPVVRG